MEVARVARRRGGHGSGSSFGGGSGRVPVPKLSSRNSKLGRARGRKPPGKVAKTFGVLIVLAFFGLAVGGFVDLTELLPYRAGWAGTAGTLSAITCRTVGSRSPHQDCHGDFADGGRNVVVSVEGDSSYSVAREYPARLHADGQSASVTSGKSVAYILGGMLAVLALVVFIGWFVVLAVVGFVMRRRLGGVWRPGKWSGMTPLFAGAGLLAAGIVSGIVGAALSF